MKSSVAEMLARLEPSAIDPSKPTARSTIKTLSSTELAFCLKGLTEPQYNLFAAMYLQQDSALALFALFWRDTISNKSKRQKWGNRAVSHIDIANVSLYELLYQRRLINAERCHLLGISRASTHRLSRYMDCLADLRDIHDRAVDKVTHNYLSKHHR